MNDPNAIVRIKNLRKIFNNRLVLDNINLSINAGESFVLLGRSGVGKSVLLSIISGLVQTDYGSCFVNDINVTDVDFASSEVGYLSQEIGLLSDMTVWENISFANIYKDGMDRKLAKENAIKAMIGLGIREDLVDLYPHQLSGGTQKKVGIARAISRNCKMILLDEPTSSLDAISANEVSLFIRQCNKNLGMSIILVTHDICSVSICADRVGILDSGSLEWLGTKDEFFQTDDTLVLKFLNAGKVHL